MNSPLNSLDMDNQVPQKEIYEILPPEIYYEAITKGNAIQRFWHDQKFDTVLNKIDFTQKDYVMDIGCGPGVLLSRIFKKVTLAIGMDISKNQVKFTNDTLKNNHNIVGACQSLSFKDNSLDYAFMVEVLEHLHPEETDRSLKSIYETLKEGGILILTTPNYRSLWPIIEFVWNRINPINYNEQHINKQNIHRLKRSLIKAGFKNIQIKSIFIISPFIAIISKKHAINFIELEKRLLTNFGCLLIIKAEKC
jgi:SAM-dependent methyltransferase